MEIKKILLVSQNHAFISKIKKILSLNGFQVFSCQSLLFIPSYLNRIQIDLLLFDFSNEIEVELETVTLHLKHKATGERLPLIGITSRFNKESLFTSLPQVDEIIEKPLKPEAFLFKIKRELAFLSSLKATSNSLLH